MGAGLTKPLYKKLNVTTQSGGAASGAAIREAQSQWAPLVAPKQQTSIGCWNVRTMAEATRKAQVAKEMAEYGIEVLGLSEARWKGMG